MMELKIAEPVTLKCGLTLPNRLAKAAMAEVFADRQRLPGSKATTIYREWAKGGWGLVMTGNVQVDPRYLGQPGDVSPDDAIPREKTLAAWKKWAEACSENGTKTIVQINHPGRQSPLSAGTRSFFAKTLAPSAVPIHLGDSLVARAVTSLLFGTPKEMTVDDIQDVVRRFAATARLSADAGFAGCEIHAAHGYLLAQFLSPKTNKRTDAYGGSPKARAKIVVDIIHAIREAVPAGFCVGIKLNSVDHQNSADLSECIEQLHAITDAGIDFLEISGGTYENPTMFLGTTNKEMKVTEAREAFFIEFANAIRAEFKDVTLMVTGGFRTRKGMEAAVSEGYCDLVGVGRPAVVAPQLPKEIVFNPDIMDLKAVLKAPHINAPSLLGLLGIKMVGAGVETSWYTRQLGYIGSGKGKPKTE